MKVQVKRVSSFSSNKPCDEAVMEEYIYVDIRAFSDPKHISTIDDNGYYWYNTGTNHRLINGCIARDLIRKAWFMELDGMEGLKEFITKERHACIVSLNSSGNLMVEIYDDHR